VDSKPYWQSSRGPDAAWRQSELVDGARATDFEKPDAPRCVCPQAARNPRGKLFDLLKAWLAVMGFATGQVEACDPFNGGGGVGTWQRLGHRKKRLTRQKTFATRGPVQARVFARRGRAWNQSESTHRNQGLVAGGG